VLVGALAASACTRPGAPATPAAQRPPPVSTAALEEAARTAGLGVVACGDEEGVLLTTAGERDATVEETAAFLEAHRPPPQFDFLTPGIEGSGFGGCCAAAGGAPRATGGCVRVELWEDSPAVRALPAALAASAPGTRLRVMVTLLSLPTRRCGPRELGCGPVAYDGRHAGKPHPPGRRQLVYERERRAPSGDRCGYDGECSFKCGCVGWQSRERICDLVYYENLRDAWCGCVDGRCAWFR
jgi:hypothetical protein